MATSIRTEREVEKVSENQERIAQERPAQEPISFELPQDHAEAIRTIAAGRKIRLSGEVREGRLVVDNVSFANENFARPLFVAVNAPFKTAYASVS
jgi:hypothetical protein